MPSSPLYLRHSHNSRRLSGLTPAEHRLWRAIRSGNGVDLDFGDPATRARDRVEVCGQFIAGLLSREFQSGGNAQFRVRGIFVTGIIDLCYARISCPIVMRNCHFANAVSLDGARLAVLVLERCSMPRLDAENIEIDGDFRLDRLTAHDGVNIKGATLRHDLHLEKAEVGSRRRDGIALCADNIVVAGTIYLNKSIFRGTASMAGARVRGSVEMTDVEIFGADHMAFNGSDLEADDGIDAREVKVVGKIELIDATFKSSLGFRGACISNPGSIALALDRASIAGSIFLGDGFRAEGQVRAIGANVGGSLYLDDTRIARPPRSLNSEHSDVGIRDIGKIVRFERIEVHGHMDLSCSGIDKIFYAEGEVVLADAQVGGRVSLDGASLSAPNSGIAGRALDGARMNIKGGLHFGGEFAAKGQVIIASAQIGDSLLLGPAKFTGDEGPALDATGIHVTQDFIAHKDLIVQGSTILASAKIEGTLTLPTNGLSAENAAAVDLRDARIRTLRITGEPTAGFVDLTKASVGVLLDNPESWPKEGRIVLNGLEYDAIHMSGVKFPDRRRWLYSGTRFVRASDKRLNAYKEIRFVPQPYEMLALAYERVGEEYMRRRILCAKYRQRNRKASWRPTLGLSKVWNWVQDALIGYGYAPWRAFTWLLAILLSGTLIFYFWVQPQPLHQGAKFTLPNAFIYTLDLLLPVFKLGEVSNWHTGEAGTVVGALVVVTGWIFGATVVAAVTRILKRK